MGNWFWRKRFSRNSGKDRADKYREWVVQRQSRNEVIVSLVRAAWTRGLRVVVLVEWVQHIEILTKLFQDGVTTEFATVHGEVKVKERREAIAAFESGAIRLLLANKVFQKGVNIKTVNCIVDASAASSQTACVQKFGRGVRMAEGKEWLVYFDIADSMGQFKRAATKRRSAFKREKVPVYVVKKREGKVMQFGKVIDTAIQMAQRRGDSA